MKKIITKQQSPPPMSLLNICTALKDMRCIIYSSPTYPNYLAVDSQAPGSPCLPEKLMCSIYMRCGSLRDAYLQRCSLSGPSAPAFPSATYREDIHQFLKRMEKLGVTLIVENGDFHGFRENDFLAPDALEFIMANSAAIAPHLENN